MPVRGIRGATTAAEDTSDAIVESTRELLSELAALNGLDPEEIAYVYLTTTHDLVAEFPARAARELGWVDVPLLCGHDMDVPLPNPRSVPRCVRVLILYNTDRRQKDMRHVYLRGAAAIKADLDSMRAELEQRK